jgi:hypothetical protein
VQKRKKKREAVAIPYLILELFFSANRNPISIMNAERIPCQME